jgi:hypothetical protein
MKRLILVLAVTLFATAGTAFAQDNVDRHGDSYPTHNNIALGFHDSSAPLGVRWWFSGQKVGLDLGLGVTSDEAPDFAGIENNESLLGWTLDVGVPIVCRSWDRVHFMVRPGFRYSSQEVAFPTTPPSSDIEKDNATEFSGRLELETELFLAHNFSVSAAHGIEFVSSTPAQAPGGPSPESSTNFRTVGGNFTNVGFHIYLWGPQ